MKVNKWEWHTIFRHFPRKKFPWATRCFSLFDHLHSLLLRSVGHNWALRSLMLDNLWFLILLASYKLIYPNFINIADFPSRRDFHTAPYIDSTVNARENYFGVRRGRKIIPKRRSEHTRLWLCACKKLDSLYNRQVSLSSKEWKWTHSPTSLLFEMFLRRLIELRYLCMRDTNGRRRDKLSSQRNSVCAGASSKSANSVPLSNSLSLFYFI